MWKQRYDPNFLYAHQNKQIFLVACLCRCQKTCAKAYAGVRQNVNDYYVGLVIALWLRTL